VKMIGLWVVVCHRFGEQTRESEAEPAEGRRTPRSISEKWLVVGLWVGGGRRFGGQTLKKVDGLFVW